MTNHQNGELRKRSFGPRDLAAAFFRHKKKALAFVVTTLALAAVVIVYAPRKYRSESAVFLQVGRESVRLDPTATTGKTMALQQSGRDSEIATAIEVLKRRSIVEQTVDRLTPEVVLGEAGGGEAQESNVLDTVLAPLHYVAASIKGIDPISKREEAIIEVMENMWVFAEFDSTVIVVTYDGETPQLSQKVVQTIVDVFEDEHARLHRTVGSKPFFEQQRAELEQKLADAELKLRDAKNRAGIASVDARRDTLETRLADIELARNSAAQQLAAAEARIAALQERTDAMPERIHTSTRLAPNTGADALRTEFYELQVRLLDLESKFKPEHPLVEAARTQLADAKRAIENEPASREETEDGLNDNHRSLALDLARAEGEQAALGAQVKELDSQKAIAQAELKQLNDYELETDKLEREQALASTNFFTYAEAYEQARMDEELNRERITNVNVVQQATLAEKPVSPSKGIVGALAILFSMAGATALVLGCERFDSRLRSEEQIEQTLQIPVLAAVPEGREFGGLPVAAR